MRYAKLAGLLRKGYVQIAVMVLITIVAVIFFWYGLRLAFRTEHPLLAVDGASMRPTLEVGDLILVQGVLNASEVNAAPRPEGDILVFRKSNKLIVHRAIDKKREGNIWYFETKGDNNDISDGWIPEQNVVGKVVGRVPLLGYIALFFEPFEVKVAFILLWIILLVILKFVLLSRKKAEEERDQTKPL
jgi:signal peptidase I